MRSNSLYTSTQSIIFFYVNYYFLLCELYFYYQKQLIFRSYHDSWGLIEQPIMDWEVISISGSSLEDTHRGASNSESSSLERIRVSRRTSGGTFHPCRRVRPFITATKPILVTMILPPSTSWGVGKGVGSRDAKASPHMQCGHSVGSLSSTLVVFGLNPPIYQEKEILTNPEFDWKVRKEIFPSRIKLQ